MSNGQTRDRVEEGKVPPMIKKHNVVLLGHLLQQLFWKSKAISILDYNPHSLSRICWIVQVHIVIKVVLEDGWILDLNTSEITALQVCQIIRMQEKIKHAKLQFKEISNLLQDFLMLMVVRDSKLIFQINLFLLELMLANVPFIGGIFNNCKQNLKSESIMVGIDQNGVWEVRNQWRSKWVENGYIRLAPENTCSVCAAASYTVLQKK